MAQEKSPPAGPDLAKGVAISDFVDGKLLGHLGKEEILVVRSNAKTFAIGAHCTHYHGPLADGLVVGNTVRCPWHHACFDLQTGEAIRAPALSSVSTWRAEERDGRIYVLAAQEQMKTASPLPKDAPQKIVIVGGGAAGFAAAEMLRRHGYAGSIAMLSSDPAAPVDRPNLSKDYLAGSAPEEWVPLRPDEFYGESKIDIRLGTEVAELDLAKREVVTSKGERIAYDRLLLATGAEPLHLSIPGADARFIHTLRSLDDCRAIIAAAGNAKRAVLIGASFIALEVAASLRARNIEVHVVAPEKTPMERVLGREMGAFVRTLHEEKGVIFHLEDTVAAIEGKKATLRSGTAIESDLIVMGVGVRPRLALAERAGLAIDRGVVVDDYLETSASRVFAAGDIARWPDPHSGGKIRVEHWVVAQRQGQTAALNMLGLKQKFDAVPFFWSQHYDVPINYVGHAEHWDEIVVEGDIAARDCLLRYKRGGKTLAVSSIYRDLASLEAELKLERGEIA
jgi:apoptosis-inducing factor 3